MTSENVIKELTRQELAQQCVDARAEVAAIKASLAAAEHGREEALQLADGLTHRIDDAEARAERAEAELYASERRGIKEGERRTEAEAEVDRLTGVADDYWRAKLAAEARAERAEAECGRMTRENDGTGWEVALREQTRAQASESRAAALEAEIARLRAALRHDGFECDGCLTGGMHDITTRECIDGPNSRTATEAMLDASESRADALALSESAAVARQMAADSEAQSWRQRAAALAEALREVVGVVEWMSGSDDFGNGGKAEQGWLKALPILARARAVLAPPEAKP